MAEFNAAHAINEVGERAEQIEHGAKFVPIAASVVAVLAALATLLSNHSSVSGLEKRTLAGISQTRAADQYSYYESSRIKIEVNRAMQQSGLVTKPDALKMMNARITKEDKKSAGILKTASAQEELANQQIEQGEVALKSYESFEIAATLFEVSVVLISITALMKTKVLLWGGGVGTVLGLIYLAVGLIKH